MGSSNDVWEFYTAKSETDRSSLTESERGILAILDLRQEVASGGFDSYFRYWGGDTAAEALTALPIFLDEDWASVLREAMNTLGSPYPNDSVTRERLLDESAAEDWLSTLDERIYELEVAADTDARLSEALAALRG